MQLALDLRGPKNCWGTIPHPCPLCGAQVLFDAIMSEILCDDCHDAAECELAQLRRRGPALPLFDQKGY